MGDCSTGVAKMELCEYKNQTTEAFDTGSRLRNPNHRQQQQ